MTIEIDPSLNAEKVARINEIISLQLGIAEADIKPTDSFVDHYGADSLDLVELSMAFEDDFEREIPDEDMERWKTVNDAYLYLAKL